MAQIAFPGEAHGSTNYFVANGMGEYPEKITARQVVVVVNIRE